MSHVRLPAMKEAVFFNMWDHSLWVNPGEHSEQVRRKGDCKKAQICAMPSKRDKDIRKNGVERVDWKLVGFRVCEKWVDGWGNLSNNVMVDILFVCGLCSTFMEINPQPKQNT